MRQVNRDGRLLGWLIVLLVCVVTVARTQDHEPSVVPWFETRAPGASGDSRVAASREWAVAFRVDATVRWPLLIAKIPIASRASVGMTTFSTRYFTTDRRTGVRAYEFYAASFPDGARGLNRLGSCARRWSSPAPGSSRRPSSGSSPRSARTRWPRWKRCSTTTPSCCPTLSSTL